MANNIFQPELSPPDISAAGRQISAGPVDTTTASLIKTVGEVGIAAFKGKKKADLRADIQEDIHGFFRRGEQEILGGKGLDAQVMSEEEALQSEVDNIALEEGRRRVARLKRLKATGAGSVLELKARAETDVKELVNDYPGLADEFRSLYNNELNDYAARISLLDKKRADALEDEAAARKAQEAYIQDVATYHAIPITGVQQQHIKDFQQQTAMQNMKTFTENTVAQKADQGTLALGDIEEDVQVSTAIDLLTIGTNFNQGVYQGINVAEMRMEGASTDTILEKLFANDVSRTQFKDSSISQIKRQIIKINKQYTVNAAKLGGIPQSTVEDSRRDSLKMWEEMLSSIENDNETGDGLKTFVSLMQNYEQGQVAGFAIANPTFNLMTKTGLMTRDTMTQYMTNPELFSKDNPAMYKVLKRVESGQLAADILSEQHTKAFEDPSEFDVYRKYNTEIADSFVEIAGVGINKVKVEGFSDDKIESSKQKDWFTRYSKVMLTQVKEGSLNSYRAMEKFFFDPNYMEAFNQLPENNKEELADIISDKAKLTSDNNINELNKFDIGATRDFNIFFSSGRLKGFGAEKLPFFDILGEGGVRAAEIRKFDDNLKRLNNSLKAQWRMELATGNKITFKEFVQPTLVELGLKKKEESE